MLLQRLFWENISHLEDKRGDFFALRQNKKWTLWLEKQLKAHVIQVYSATHLVMDNFLLMSSSSGSSCHREDFFYEKDETC